MNEQPSRGEQEEGDWKQWDQEWEKSKGTPNQLLFISGQPVTRRQFRMQGYFKDMFEMVGENAPNAKFLELGSGRGTISMYLAEKESDVTLVDLSETGLKMAKSNFRDAGLPEPETCVADVRETRLESDQYDCVFNIGLLEHFEDPVPVIEESLRLLKPGGLLFSVIVPPTPRSRQWPIQLMLNPIMSSYRVGRQIARNLIKGPPKTSGQMVRTDFTREKWIDWTFESGGVEVRCVPYNCYHEVYRSNLLEESITVPLYRWHQHRKRSQKKLPAFATSASLACADLLYCRKSSSA